MNDSKIMLSVSTDVKHHRRYVMYNMRINDDTAIVFEVVYKIRFDHEVKTLKFNVVSSKVYMEREMNKFHIKHIAKSDGSLTLDQFSLWLAMDLWVPGICKIDNVLNNLEFDKITIHVS